ncbi:MAG: hypothetical protein LBM98_02325 [Oscillospiraceae bacterium]|nr:hypothetical protein [Oscillospiraceae bacterium]
MRYVERIGTKQSSAGSVTYVLRTYVSQGSTSTLDCFAAFHRYVSQVRRRLRNDGLGEAQPCPGALRRDGGRGYVRARRGEGGFETRPYVHPAHGATKRPNQSSLIFDI